LKRKVLVVDLDGTLFKINTFHYFIKYLCVKCVLSLNFRLLYRLLLALSSRLFRSHAEMKYQVLKLLQHRTDIDYLDFLNSIYSKKRELNILNDETFHIKILATAAPTCYANIIAKKEHFDICLGTDFLLSDKMNFDLQKVLSKEIILKSNIEDNIQKYTELILDSNTFSYKTIITILEENYHQKFITYKILVKDSNYIIGSDSVVCRGEVVAY
jgi:phosphoserine phosphatase